MGLFGVNAVTTGLSKECFVQSNNTFGQLALAQFPLLCGQSNINDLRRKETNKIICRMTKNNHDTEGNDKDRDATGKTLYTPTKHSEEFLRHLESVKSSWPYNGEDVTDQTSDISSDYSVQCTGEPSMDPSRMLQSLSDDDYDWV